MRKFRRDQRSVKPRLLVLIAALVITAVWARSELDPRRGSAAGGSPRQGTGSAIAATALEPMATGDQATPEGWGADPFDPRPLGSTPVTTGR